MRIWLAIPGKGLRDRPREPRRAAHLSKIFDWFEEDFEAAGRRPGAFERYATPARGRGSGWSGPGRDLRLRYFDYDWSLNDVATLGVDPDSLRDRTGPAVTRASEGGLQIAAAGFARATRACSKSPVASAGEPSPPVDRLSRPGWNVVKRIDSTRGPKTTSRDPAALQRLDGMDGARSPLISKTTRYRLLTDHPCAPFLHPRAGRKIVALASRSTRR